MEKDKVSESEKESLKKDQKQWSYIRYLLTNPTKIYEMLNKLNRNKVTKE